MMGEQVALVNGLHEIVHSFDQYQAEQGHADIENEHEGDDEPEELDDSEKTDVELVGITFAEIQYHSQALATHLYYRFGVRPGDHVLISASGSTASELVSMLACLLLSAVFIPFDLDSTLSEVQHGINSSKARLEMILEATQPAAAIVIGRDDEDPAVLLLASLRLFRCALLTWNGMLVETDATVTSALIDTLPTILSSSSEERDDEEDKKECFDRPLYILFTSGSSGVPKGVIGTHRGLLNRLAWQYDTFPYEAGEVVLRRTPLTFVDSLAEIFAPVLAGVPLAIHLMEKVNTEGLHSIAQEACEIGISRFTMIPSILSQSLRLCPDLGQLWGVDILKVVFVSGEPCAPALVQTFSDAFPQTRLVNIYGSTEVAGDVTYSLQFPAERLVHLPNGELVVPIGRALPHNYLFIVHYDSETGSIRFLSTLDDEGRVCGVDDRVVGELLVIGDHVAMGYIPDHANKHRFLPNPFHAKTVVPSDLPKLPQSLEVTVSAHSKAFLTGDLVRLHEETKQLIYVGRSDRQVKLHGQRLELDDAERRLRDVLGLAEGVVVLTVADQPSPETPNQFLTLIDRSVLESAKSAVPMNGVELKTWVLEHSSGSHVLHNLLSVATVLVISSDMFPRTQSHKIDRQQLLADLLPLLEVDESSDVSEQVKDDVIDMANDDNEVRSTILTVYRDILSPYLPPEFSISCDKDFFSLGGDSLMSIEVLWRLRRAFPNVSLPAPALRESITSLANRIHVAQSQQLDHLVHEPLAKKARTTSSTLQSSSSSVQHVDIVGLPIMAGECTAVITRANRSQEAHGQELKGLLSISNEVLDARAGHLTIQWTHKMLKCIDASPLLCIFTDHQQSDRISQLIYIASHGGDICCLEDDGKEGHKRWRMETGEHIESAMAVNRLEGIVYCSSYRATDIHAAPTNASNSGDAAECETHMLGAIRALNMITGEMVWMQELEGECKATVAVSEKLQSVYVGSYDGKVTSFNSLTGELQCCAEVEGAVYAMPTLNQDDRQLIVATTRGHLCVFTTTPYLICTNQIVCDSPLFSTPLVSEVGILVAGMDGGLRTLRCGDEGSLELLWESYPCAGPVFSSACLTSGSTAVLGSHDGTLRHIDLQTGEVIASVELQAALFASPFFVPLVSGGGRIICATTAGDIYCVLLKDKEMTVEYTIRLEAEIFSSPVVYFDRVYIGCRNDRIYCLSIED
eukprot:scaffold2507_cov257-Ochromonas_danica.AAC.13